MKEYCMVCEKPIKRGEIALKTSLFGLVFVTHYECLPEPCPNCGQIRNKNCEDGICPTQKKEIKP
jgi:hypothetical protein